MTSRTINETRLATRAALKRDIGAHFAATVDKMVFHILVLGSLYPMAVRVDDSLKATPALRHFSVLPS
jgi:hypothetical protein